MSRQVPVDLITAAVEHENLVGETHVIFYFFDIFSEYSEALRNQMKTALEQLLDAGFELLITIADHKGVEILDLLV
ncbi:hypothetical protein L596_022386 [Steinernema carpocapsae]|uniref:Uncharacterized protein n=1 Tax=Steinernema carpocapsae TaxID=34508 RepID=A0A4U5MLL8_STECR|nr:hypothetical protein L596_022386 [Steinernema carpocapsae]